MSLCGIKVQLKCPYEDCGAEQECVNHQDSSPLIFTNTCGHSYWNDFIIECQECDKRIVVSVKLKADVEIFALAEKANVDE